jgi:hypothetical protein
MANQSQVIVSSSNKQLDAERGSISTSVIDNYNLIVGGRQGLRQQRPQASPD